MIKITFKRGDFRTDLSRRIPEEEVINGLEGTFYANRKDDRTLSYKMVAYDINERFPIKNEHKILEVCCGAGQLARYLHLLTGNCNIIATDGGKELINAAKERCYNSLPIKFEVCNVHNHPYKGENDLVICKDAFHHFHDSVKSMNEMLNLLKSNGVLYIFDLVRECPPEQIEHRLNLIQDNHEGKRFLQSLNASFTIEEMKDIIKKSTASKFDSIYPFRFSNVNLTYHSELIRKNKVKEHLLDRLFAVYLIHAR